MGVISLVVRLQTGLQIIRQPVIMVSCVFLAYENVDICEALQLFHMSYQGVIGNDDMQ